MAEEGTKHPKKSARQRIANKTRQIIHVLYNSGNINKAGLAYLRQSKSMTSPKAMMVLPDFMRFMDADMISQSGELTRAEVAVFTAVRLYAFHQQSKDVSVYGPVNTNTNDSEEPLGKQIFTVLRELRKNLKTRQALDGRVQQILGATNIASVNNSLNQLIRIIKSADLSIPIDYGLLARDLFDFQMSYEQANRVRLRWGQQYFKNIVDDQTDNNEGEK
ncbi:type I-E CRISPR-associated protein Cse2/CasB [Secundilactobacillus kimchicus]|uniref:type I-E CRISPR-associated protein Cse2/CasB n=1 Tax=Secundilactobacillus kimchicus TaxID=528209 RepID=UPI0024A7E71A|nr:type I-E CRISPR-associated protein Cse2/CasB [Secundilactobacillus kimchicus]